jgi:DNA-binding HxlR family transcriptional regulator
MIYEPNICPFRYGLGVFGDRWSLLIIRDMMFRGFTRFHDFMDSGEGISSNVLSDRLNRLESQNIISRRKDPSDGRQVLYELTDQGKDLAPVMLTIISWAEKYDPETNISQEWAERIRTDLPAARDEVLTEMRKFGAGE